VSSNRVAPDPNPGGNGTDKLKIMVPVGEARQVAPSAQCTLDLKGKVVAFVSNEHWLSLGAIWKKMAEVLESQGVSSTFKTVIPAMQAPPAQIVDEVVSRADVALVGLAN